MVLGPQTNLGETSRQQLNGNVRASTIKRARLRLKWILSPFLCGIKLDSRETGSNRFLFFLFGSRRRKVSTFLFFGGALTKQKILWGTYCFTRLLG